LSDENHQLKDMLPQKTLWINKYKVIKKDS